MAEDATLLEGRKTKLELSKDATLCGTPKQQRNFIWVAFYALAITCGLVLRRASILEREATLDAAMDPSAWEIKVLNCANLRCHLSVKTSVAFPKAASFVVSYWPLDAAEYAVYSREHEVSSAATEVELYRLRPHTQYVARVRLKAEGFDKIVVVAEQTFESNAVGCNKFDNGPMVRIEGDPSFELLLFPYMDGETDSFRGLVAVDRAGYAVWYFNRTISAPGAHVEAFSQFTSMRDTAHFCVNDQNTVSVFVADAAGSVGATLLPEHVSNRTKNGTALESWTFMGHECRATRGGQIVTTGFALADVGSQKLEVEDESIHYLAEEFFLLWDPFVEDEPVTELVWVSDYVSLEDAVKALDGEGDNEKVIMEIVDVDDAVAATGSYLMYFHVSSVSLAPDEDLYVVTLRNLHTVIAINRTSLELVWQFSSVLERNDFSFASPSDRFWDPHDAVLDTVNGTQRLCLMDEGYFRDACEEQSESVDYYCYSRGVCYVLDAASGSASKAYDYSFPNNGVLSSLHLEAMDVFNKNGGDVVPVPDTRHMLTAFTSVYKTQFASNSYAFETDADGGETKAIIKLPHIEDWTSASGGTSGLYRVLPITSVNGEGAHAPEAWLSHTS
ncbi:hypothetical protein SO694_00053215 [Aureococcus anophagefferens]|uniref:Fibronectin type-III domain-containing protein n=1 Tax=Aureococcus anophagefferens TaxID=44056 RepID=A0ABR1FXY9_AURAN